MKPEAHPIALAWVGSSLARDVKQGWDVWGNEAEGSVNLEQYGSH